MADLKFKQGRIAYDVIGPTLPWAEAAPGIIFVHGIGADRDIWSEWRHALSPRFRTIAIDLPGHGKSFRPGAELGWDIDDLAAMVHAVGADVGLGRYCLVGESIGGTICLVAAHQRPEVAAVVTCSTAHVGGSLAHVREWRTRIAEQGFATWSKDMIEKRFTPWQTDDAHRNWFDRTQCASDSETILTLAEILVGLDYSEQLDGITCPVLLIHPDASPFIPLDIPVALKAELAHAELKVIPGARHGIACSHAIECAGAASAFLERHVLRPVDEM